VCVCVCVCVLVLGLAILVVGGRLGVVASWRCSGAQVTSAGTIVVDSPLYTHCRLLLCVSVSAAELVGHCFQTDSTAELRSFSHIKYFILDGRPEAQYQAGHLPCAYSLVHARESGCMRCDAIRMDVMRYDAM
jgi:hypothetical protein